MNTSVWTVEIAFRSTNRYELHADARLTAGLDQLHGQGSTKKNPSDPHTPAVAAEIAAARALDDLSGQLVGLADERMAAWADDELLLLPW